MCNGNTVRESTHISFFYGGDPFCKVVRRPKNTHMFAWVTSGSLPLVWATDGYLPFVRETSGPLPFVWATTGSLSSVQNYRPFIVFSSSMRKYKHSHRFTYFFLFMAGYRNLFISFFSGNLLMLSANSIHRQSIIFFAILLCPVFPVTHIVDVILQPHWSYNVHPPALCH